MIWILFALGAVVMWGMYGPALHRGQVLLGNPLRALLCVGVAYFLIGVLVPVLWRQGELTGFHMRGSVAATLAGVLGAVGAVCIIYGFCVRGASDLCDAAGLCRRSRSQCRGFDGNAPAKDRAESAALPRFSPGLFRCGHGALLQAAGLALKLYVQPG